MNCRCRERARSRRRSPRAAARARPSCRRTGPSRGRTVPLRVQCAHAHRRHRRRGLHRLAHLRAARRARPRGHRASTRSTAISIRPSVKRRNAAELAQLARLPARRRRHLRPRGDRARDHARTSTSSATSRRSPACGRRSREPLRYLRTNIEGTGVIIERMRALGLQRLVFASSSSVYGAKPRHRGRRVSRGRSVPDAGVAVRGDEADERAAAVGVSRPVRARRVRAALLHRLRPAPAPRHGDREVHRARSRAASRSRCSATARRGATTRSSTTSSTGTVAAIERVAARRATRSINLGGTQTISLAELVEIDRARRRQARDDRSPARSARRRADHVREHRSRARGARLRADDAARARHRALLGLAPARLSDEHAPSRVETVWGRAGGGAVVRSARSARNRPPASTTLLQHDDVCRKERHGMVRHTTCELGEIAQRASGQANCFDRAHARGRPLRGAHQLCVPRRVVSHFRQDFPGQRTTVGCIDLAVERRLDLIRWRHGARIFVR